VLQDFHDAQHRILAGDARRHHPAAGAAFPQGIVGGFVKQLIDARDNIEGRIMSDLAIQGRSRKSFGGVRPSTTASFDIKRGELLALIGPNGAGKSTCFNMVNGQLPPDSGEIWFEGKELVGRKPRDIWRLGIGRTFQIAATFNSMTVIENVQMALISHANQVFSLWKPASSLHRERALELLDQVGMQDRRRSAEQRTGLWRRQARRAGDRARQRSQGCC
jgi:ABC-type uncharacterized transport system ATPase subunit